MNRTQEINQNLQDANARFEESQQRVQTLQQQLDLQQEQQQQLMDELEERKQEVDNLNSQLAKYALASTTTTFSHTLLSHLSTDHSSIQWKKLTKCFN